jgi:hypothetical protein
MPGGLVSYSELGASNGQSRHHGTSGILHTKHFNLGLMQADPKAG